MRGILGRSETVNKIFCFLFKTSHEPARSDKGPGPYFRAIFLVVKAEVRRSFITTTVREQRPRSHHKGATGGFELATNSIQFYAIANLDT